MSVGRNDPCPCGSGKKYKNCCLNKIFKTEDLPFYKILKTDSQGSISLIVSRERPDGNLQFVSVLVDMWKMGLKNCFGDRNVPKNRFNSVYNEMALSRGIKFIECSIDETRRIIKNGLRIANDLKLPIPEKFYEFKDIVGNLDDVKVEGSLYKCFKCGKGELSKEYVDYIKKVALNDVKKNVCGTPKETMIYFTCEKCKNKKGIEK